MSEEKHRIPIWFFIGSILLIYGALIFGQGLYHLFHPPERVLVLSEYHPDIWWGLLLLLLGGFYCFKFSPRRS